MTYMPKKHEDKLLESVTCYRKIQNLLNELSEANLKKLLKER